MPASHTFDDNILWLDNTNSSDPLSYKEAYRDGNNSPYTIVDKVAIVMEEDPSGERLYTLSSEEANRIECRLQSGVNSEEDGDDDADDGRVTYRTRTGRSEIYFINI